MDDYIKREDAIKAVANNYWHGTECECYAFAHKALDGIQSADVVPVVRCGDCKRCHRFADDSNSNMKSWCLKFSLSKRVNDDDFCAWGERKGDD